MAEEEGEPNQLFDRLDLTLREQKSHFVDPAYDVSDFRAVQQEQEYTFEHYVRGSHNGSLMERDSELLLNQAGIAVQRTVNQFKTGHHDITIEKFLNAVSSLDDQETPDAQRLLRKLGRTVIRNSQQTFGWIWDPIELPEEVIRETRARRARPTGDAARPNQVLGTEMAEAGPVKHLVETMHGLLVAHAAEHSDAPDIFRVVMNAAHFGETVENVYALSFLVASGKVSIYNEDGVTIPLVKLETERQSKAKDREQFIFTLSYSQWRQLGTKYSGDPFMPTRSGTDSAAT